jgi:Right handed beta helix region
MQVNKCQSVVLITLLISGGSWYGTAQAGTLLVCATCNHTTIQSAVNDAADNDEINIAAGRYIENITISGKSLTLLGAANVNGSGETLVLAAGRGPVFTLGSGVAGDTARVVLLDGMTISGGNHNGGTGVGGGVQVRSGSYLRMVNCVVRNSYAFFGGGIGVSSPGAPTSTIVNSLISDNTAPGPLGKGSAGGGVFVASGSSLSIDSTTIARNTSGGGGGIYSEKGSTVNLTNSTVTQNSTYSYSTPQGPTDGDGAGMESLGDFTISDSLFTFNTSFGENGGGGLLMAIQDSGPHTIMRSTFTHNGLANSLRGGGIFAYAYAIGTYTLDHSFVEQNLAGGGVWTETGATPVITNTVVTDNTGGNICTDSGGCQ